MTMHNHPLSKQEFPQRFFAVAFLISILAIIFSAWQLWRLHERFEETSSKHLVIAERVGRIMQFNEVLTMSARMAAATGDFSYEKRYDHFDPLLTKEILAVRAALPQSEIEQFARETDEANVLLVKMERQAFALVHQGRQQEAMDLLTGDEYMRLKNAYAGGMDKTTKAAHALIESDNRETQILFLWLLAASAVSVLALLFAWFFAARSTNSWAAERKATEQIIRDMAFHDVLTKLPNRRMLIDRLSQAMAASKRNSRYGSLMYLDLDNFKQANDTHGHEVGDWLLIEVAQRITSCMREMDTVARVGGDEFVVILRELDLDKGKAAELAGIVAEKIRVTLAEPYLVTIHKDTNSDTTVEHRCSASIGVVLFIGHEATAEDIINRADMAMLEAKKKDGCNLIRFAGMGEPITSGTPLHLINDNE